MKKIEIETWARRKYFEFFKAFDAPHFNVTANVDVTNLYTYAKEEQSIVLQTLFIRCGESGERDSGIVLSDSW